MLSNPELIAMNKLRIFLALYAFTCTQTFSQNALFEQQMEIGFEERQGQYVDLDVKLVNESGDTVILRDILKKPTILNLVYFRCPGVCSPIMFGVSKFIDAIDLKLGEDYQVMTVSFDYNENIDLGIKKKESYISTMKNKESAAAWQFFVSDSANIARLTNSAGFLYKKMGFDFVHPAGLIALAADGKITRYLGGIEFLPFDIKITLVEAADGKIGPSINRLLAVCYSYDSQGNMYVFNIMKVSGIVILFLIISLFLYLSLHRLNLKWKAQR